MAEGLLAELIRKIEVEGDVWRKQEAGKAVGHAAVNPYRVELAKRLKRCMMPGCGPSSS